MRMRGLVRWMVMLVCMVPSVNETVAQSSGDDPLPSSGFGPARRVLLLPHPIDANHVEAIAAALVLPAEARVRLADQFAAYLSAVSQEIEPRVSTLQSLAVELPAIEPSDPQFFESNQAFEHLRVDVVERLGKLDGQLLGQIAGMVADPAALDLVRYMGSMRDHQRLLAAQHATAHRMARWSIAEAVLRELGGAFPSAGQREWLEEYLARANPLLRDALRAARDATVSDWRWMARAAASQDGGDPSSSAPSTDRAGMWQPLIDLQGRIAKLNRGAIERLDLILDGDRATAVRSRFLARAFPEIHPDPNSCGPAFDAAEALELTDDQRALLVALEARVESELAALHREAEELVGEWELRSWVTGGDPEGRAAYRRALADELARRRDLQSRAVEDLMLSLDPAQREAIRAAAEARPAEVVDPTRRMLELLGR